MWPGVFFGRLLLANGPRHRGFFCACCAWLGAGPHVCGPASGRCYNGLAMISQPDPSSRGAFETDGFYITDGPILPAAVVQAAVEGIEQIRAGRYDRGRPPVGSAWNPGDDPGKFCKIEQPQFADQAIYDLVSHSVLGAWAAQLTGATMIQAWWVQLLCKPPASPSRPGDTKVGWHQDRSYWTCWTADSTLLTAWVALSDVGPDCGPMKFLRGSHRWGFKEGLSDFFGQDLDQQRQRIAAFGAAWDEVDVLLPAGGVSFHDRLTFHASHVNTSPHPRCSLAIHLRSERCWPEPKLPSSMLRSFTDQPDLCPVLVGSL